MHLNLKDSNVFFAMQRPPIIGVKTPEHQHFTHLFMNISLACLACSCVIVTKPKYSDGSLNHHIDY